MLHRGRRGAIWPLPARRGPRGRRSCRCNCADLSSMLLGKRIQRLMQTVLTRVMFHSFHLAKNNPYLAKPRIPARQATVRRWKTAINQAYRDNADQQKPRYGASCWHLAAGLTKMVSCSAISSSRLADGSGAGKRRSMGKPEWYLSYQKAMSASSSEEGREPSFAADENIQTWWRAAGTPGEWISMDLGEVKRCPRRTDQFCG